jgi:hypothetical protein
MFLLSQLPPATHSRSDRMTITNEYFLNATLNYEGSCCTSNKPSLSLPLTIIPINNDALFGFIEPEGYNPVVLGYYKMNL